MSSLPNWRDQWKPGVTSWVKCNENQRTTHWQNTDCAQRSQMGTVNCPNISQMRLFLGWCDNAKLRASGAKRIQAITPTKAENHKCTSQIRTFHQPCRFCTSAYLCLSIRLSFHFQFTRPHSFRSSAPPQTGSHENIGKRATAPSKHWEWNLWPFQLGIFAQEGWGVLDPFIILFYCLGCRLLILPVLRRKSCLVEAFHFFLAELEIKNVHIGLHSLYVQTLYHDSWWFQRHLNCTNGLTSMSRIICPVGTSLQMLWICGFRCHGDVVRHDPFQSHLPWIQTWKAAKATSSKSWIILLHA